LADVFISYARDDRDWVQALARQIEGQGLSVWWDIHNRPGQSFDTQIERELNAAKSVIVVWSKDSVGSRWVRAEAGDAMERGILVPILKDAIVPPLAFRQIHCANLSGWTGGMTGELPGLISELRVLASKQADIAAIPNFAHEAPTAAELALLDRARETIACPPQTASSRQPPPRRAKRSRLLWPMAMLVAALAGAALYLMPTGQPVDAGPEALVPTVEPGPDTPTVADLPTGDTLQTAPQPTKRVTPRYPRRAEEREREGSVALDVTVGEGGAVTAVRIVSETPSGFGFGDSAEAAVRQWEFATARPGRYAVTVKFTLN
jgi:TonB family protein